MASYFLRLCVHNIPPAEQIVSMFLPLGPCGQGAYGLMVLSAGLRRLAYEENLGLLATSVGADEAKMAATAIYGCSILVALVMWGFGAFWLCTAVSTILDMWRKGGFPFNMGWCVSESQIASFLELTSPFRNRWGSVFETCAPMRALTEVLSSRRFTFPVGTFALAANTFAIELGSTPFRVIGTVLSSCEILLWLFIASRTAYGAFTGTL